MTKREKEREREKIRAIAAFLFSSFLLLSFRYLSAPSSQRGFYRARARVCVCVRAVCVCVCVCVCLCVCVCAVNDIHSGVGRRIGRCRDDDIGEARVNAPRENGTARRSANLLRGAVS